MFPNLKVMNEQEEKKNRIYYLCLHHLLICKINHARSIALHAFYSFGIRHASNKHKINYGVPSYILDPMNDIKLCTHSTHFRQVCRCTEQKCPCLFEVTIWQLVIYLKPFTNKQKSTLCSNGFVGNFFQTFKEEKIPTIY